MRAAAVRLAAHVRRTPVLTSEDLSRRLGARVWFKCENFQYAGAFKSRGACNAVFALASEQAARGVLTHSSGNHGAALARAAQRRGIPAWVVMPTNVSAAKRANVLSFGAQLVECEPTLAARESAAAELLRRTGASLVHPYDDPLVIAGQGTALLELETAALEPALVLAPVGGGGLLSGSALVARRLWPRARVIGAEPAGADDAARSFACGERVGLNGPAQTSADGLRGELSARTFGLLRANVDSIVTVSEEAIVVAMRYVWQALKMLIEPSSAVPVAALLEGKLAATGPVVIVISGGNVDLDSLPFGRA